MMVFGKEKTWLRHIFPILVYVILAVMALGDPTGFALATGMPVVLVVFWGLFIALGAALIELSWLRDELNETALS